MQNLSQKNLGHLVISKKGKKGNFVKSDVGQKFMTPSNMSKIGKKGKIAKF